MLKVGLTGGIACGKSAVAAMFATRGVRVCQADEVAHQLMRPGQPVYEAVVSHFGRDILTGGGSIDRQKLAQLAFSSEPPRIEELNRLVHPAVRAYQDHWSAEVGRSDSHAIAMVEAALILETGGRERFDRLVVVVCHPEQKVERLAKRLRIDLEAARREVERRSRAQWPDEEKARQADFLIQNTGTLEQTERQVEQVFSQLQREAETLP
jgi:dephospho-CoA kinase